MNVARMKSRLHGAKFEGERIALQDLRSIQAPVSTWRDCTFTACRLDNGILTGAMLSGCLFERCCFDKVSLDNSMVEGCRFVECNMEQTSIRAGLLKKVMFVDCRMYMASFRASYINQGFFSHCNLHHADIGWSEAKSVGYRKCNFWNAYIQLGCQMFEHGVFDEKSVDMFVGMIARRHPNPMKACQLRALAGRAYDLVDRLIGQEEANVL